MDRFEALPVSGWLFSPTVYRHPGPLQGDLLLQQFWLEEAVPAVNHSPLTAPAVWGVCVKTGKQHLLFSNQLLSR